MVIVVDYGMGNLRSVSKALEFLGFEAEITRDADRIRRGDHLILPGDAAFGAAMDNLRRYGLLDVVLQAIRSGKPFLGICAGIQLLMDQSEERGVHAGMGVVPGNVLRFFQKTDTNAYTSTLKVPHMGWNTIQIRKNAPIFRGVPDGSMMYFVHSYYVVPESDVVAATTDHGIEFCSVIWKDNVYATQFHPEKSGSVGLQMLANFVELS